MRVRSWCALLIIAAALTGCALRQTPETVRLALLAPFEGRYREIGYNALYAARLAVQDANLPMLELLPLDDGGTAASASDRARALALDPQVIGALTLGYAASDPAALAAFADMPVVIVGHWDAQPDGETVFSMSSPQLAERITAPTQVDITEAAALDTPLVGGDIFALEGLGGLRIRLDDILIVSSGRLPDDDFVERYRHGNPFAPQPNLLAPVTYDALALMTAALQTDAAPTRASLRAAIAVHFTAGYWREAQIRAFRYGETGELVAVPD